VVGREVEGVRESMRVRVQMRETGGHKGEEGVGREEEGKEEGEEEREERERDRERKRIDEGEDEGEEEDGPARGGSRHP